MRSMFTVVPGGELLEIVHARNERRGTASHWIGFQAVLHRALNCPIHKLATGEVPLIRAVRFRSPLEDGEFPSVHLARVRDLPKT